MIDFQNEYSHWRELGRVEPNRLTAARLNLHYAAQIVSAVGATLLPPQPDDSHTNLEWLPSHGVLAGNLIDWEQPFRAAVRAYNLTLQLLDADHNVLAEQSLINMKYDDGIAWMTGQIENHSGSSLKRKLVRREYDLPDHPLAKGEPFTVDTFQLKELALWFANADLLLQAVARQESLLSAVRCWPHHFDIATIIDCGDGKSIGIGLEPGDDYFDQPYWYVRGYPNPQSSELPDLAGGGNWHVRDWQGAVLPGTEIVGASRGDQQCRQVGEFLNSAIAACKTMLGVG